MNRARESFSDVFEKMRQHMAWLLSQQIPSRSGIPLDIADKGNTTSITKVIDGHKYVVNETVYASGNDTVGSVFKVRVVDIRPASGEFPEIGTTLPGEKTIPTAEETVPLGVPGKNIPNIEKIDNSFENDVNRPFQKVGSPEKLQKSN